jgi:hypothetical protein
VAASEQEVQLMSEDGFDFGDEVRSKPVPRRSGRRRLTIVVLALVLLAAIALGRRGPNVRTPATAAVGGRVHVTASNLKLGDYSLSLYGRDPGEPGRFCQARLTGLGSQQTAVDFTATLPSRLPCFSTATAVRSGSTTVSPGRYALIISVLQGTGFDSHRSYISRTIQIT